MRAERVAEDVDPSVLLIDLLAREAEPAKETINNVLEVCNYLDAPAYCRREMNRPKGWPLSMWLLHEAHRRLI